MCNTLLLSVSPRFPHLLILNQIACWSISSTSYIEIVKSFFFCWRWCCAWCAWCFLRAFIRMCVHTNLRNYTSVFLMFLLVFFCASRAWACTKLTYYIEDGAYSWVFRLCASTLMSGLALRENTVVRMNQEWYSPRIGYVKCLNLSLLVIWVAHTYHSLRQVSR